MCSPWYIKTGVACIKQTKAGLLIIDLVNIIP